MTAEELIASLPAERLSLILGQFASETVSPADAMDALNDACEEVLARKSQQLREEKQDCQIRNARRLHGLFKFIVAEPTGEAKWQELRTKNKALDRDSLVVHVWNKLDSPQYREAIEKQYHSLEYHRLWLFDWLLRRYDVRNARKIVGGKSWAAANAHLLVLAAVLAVFAVRRLRWLGAHQTQGAALLCAAVYSAALAGLAWSFKPKLPDRLEAFTAATHSLIPRLAGASVVGLLFLASSLEIVPALLGTHWLWLLGVLAASYGYLLLEMARRIHPLPRLRRLLGFGADVAATALAHSITLILLAEGVLIRMLPGGTDRHSPLSTVEAFSLVVFVFSIGLVVNVIWAEQPVTEPL
jgi:hypothetical protein